MSAALATAAQPVAEDLYRTLRALDPARFEEKAAPGHAEALSSVRSRLQGLLHDAGNGELVAPLEELGRRLGAVDAAGDDRQSWMELRDSLQGEYENLVHALRSHEVRVPSLRPTNYVRNVFHVLNGLAVVLLVEFVPMPIVRWIAGSALALVTFLESIRRFSPKANEVIMKAFGAVAHPYEHHRINSGTWYVLALFILAWIGRADLGAAAVAVLALADPAASLVGRRFGKTPLLAGRTLEGSLTFSVVGFAAALLVFLVFHSAMSLPAMLVGAAVIGIVGAVAEALSQGIDDNFSIPIACTLSGLAVLSFF